MTADVMDFNVSQNPATGEIVREWLVSYTVPCEVVAVVNESVSDRSSGKEFMEGSGYKEYEVLKMTSATSISKRLKVTNIRDAVTGEVLWSEPNIAGSPTRYDVQGSVPIAAAGHRLGYQILLRRSEVQDGN
jgi:hypothetical protein